jgi:membrane dipeptidase
MLKRAAATSLVPLALLVACASAPKPSETPSGCDPALWRRASQLHHAATVVDTHTDTTSRILDEGFDMGPRAPDGHMDLPRIREGGLDVAFYSIYVASRFYGDEAPLFAKKPGDDDWPRPTDAGTANGSARRAMAMIDGLVRTADRYPDQMTVCASLEEIRATVAAGRHAACMGIEGGHAIEGQLALLRLFHQLGVRYMTLTHTNHNEYADSCADAVPRWGGLNTLGQKVVKEMNRLGMMVDVSHVSDNAFRDVLAVTRAPVICSHSSMRALCDHPRNVTDDMLRLLAQNDGVVMVNYNCGFVDAEYQKRSSQSSQTRKIQEREARRRLAEGSPELEEALKNLDARFPTPERPELSVLVAHVLHAIEVAGADHVGLGSDFDGVPCVPKGIDDVSYLPRLSYELLAAGQSEETVRKVLGGNLLRVLERVEAVAASLAGEPPYCNDLATDTTPITR